MAVTFSDLHTEAGLKALEDFISGKSYISGDQLTKDDIKVYAAVLEKPSADLYPNASKWYETVSRSSHPVFRESCWSEGWEAKLLPLSLLLLLRKLSKNLGESAADDDDDLDLFGDETEEEKKAAEQREAAKAPAKKKESGKSSVLMDIKPWDDETDMKKLEEAVRSIEMPGLLWGASKLLPVGYGIKKLHIMLTIVDDLVSVDDLIEERLTVEPCN
ncbi:hypothetical protein DH2020_027960 [Rehmannia glutinosa]|uniref:Translation elongation factor EF1B beta/delta subunit guanine nucleotide exchange domain-containing protein n=1 Tax=Rehmannia glutinosa TaxID=99300 RepID=A0ABR0VVY5_REHGL